MKKYLPYVVIALVVAFIILKIIGALSHQDVPQGEPSVIKEPTNGPSPTVIVPEPCTGPLEGCKG